MAEAALKLVETEPVGEKALDLAHKVELIKIVDATTYTAAGEFWKQIRDMMKEVADTFDPIILKAHASHKEALAQKAKYYNPLEIAQKDIKRLMSTWDAEQEKIRQAEQRRLEEIARKAAEEEALLAAIAAEEEAKRNGATKEEAKQESEAIISQPIYVPPVVLPKETPRVQGLSFRTIWKYRIDNEALIPRQYLIPDEKKIGAVIRANQGKISIPGITPYEERC